MMSKSREIEAKYLLPQTIFNKICAAYPDKTTFKQANHYFDTPEFALKRQHCGLRLRLFSQRAEQTLKVPDPRQVQQTYHEVIEVTDPLPLKLAQQLAKQKQVSWQGQVGQYLQTHLASYLPDLQQFSWSKTQRTLLNGPLGCELTLDQTSYPDGFCDYELEIENPDPAAIQQASQILQKQFAFQPSPQTSNQNKIDRAQAHAK